MNGAISLGPRLMSGCRAGGGMRRWLVESGRRMARKARFGQRPWESDLAYADRLIATLKARA